MFSAVIYSQCLRLRRIINCNGRLQKRLEELKCAFLDSDYPEKMVTKIVSKVSSMERILKGTYKKSNSQEIVPPTTPEQSVRIVSTFGSDSSLLKITQRFESGLSSSPSLTQSPMLFNYVKRTGPNLRNKLVRTKQLALNTGDTGTKPCNHRNCLTCPMISDKEDHQINGKTLKPRAGCCTTYNIIYALHCTVCNKYYVGRTVRKLQERIGEHRRSFL